MCQNLFLTPVGKDRNKLTAFFFFVTVIDVTNMLSYVIYQLLRICCKPATRSKTEGI